DIPVIMGAIPIVEADRHRPAGRDLAGIARRPVQDPPRRIRQRAAAQITAGRPERLGRAGRGRIAVIVRII
ncbi:hypothetical protein FD64_15035, partial [Staphylococcus aureus]